MNEIYWHIVHMASGECFCIETMCVKESMDCSSFEPLFSRNENKKVLRSINTPFSSTDEKLSVKTWCGDKANYVFLAEVYDHNQKAASRLEPEWKGSVRG